MMPSMAARMTFGLDLSCWTLIFGAVFVLGCSGSTTPPPPEESEANPLDSEEGTLLYELNEYRQSKGVAAAAGCVSLNVASSKHSDDMRDNDYLSDKGEDGSTGRSRACEAGYQPACDGVSMAELVGSGLEGGEATLGQWTADASTEAIILNAGLTVVGIGRSLWGTEQPAVWTVDLGASSHISCQ
jgi:uncharacterized protein YkwD